MMTIGSGNACADHSSDRNATSTLSARSRWYRLAVVPFVLTLAAGALSACSGSPTAPRESGCVERSVVFANEAFYVERSQPETEVAGRLRKNCPTPTPGGRDHCYFVDTAPVMSGTRDHTVLDRFVGSDVRIVGKRVELPPFGPEIWPGVICRQTL